MTEQYENKLFRECTRRITAAYDTLGHQHGWHFLQTPKRTFSTAAPLWFLGLNPGGRRHQQTEISVEAGNGYRVGQWGGTDDLKPLQRQVIGLFSEISGHLGMDRDELMDTSLCSNICPYRSPSWQELPAKAETMRFCRGLWLGITRQLMPSVVVTIAPQANRVILDAMTECGYSVTDQSKLSAGWGTVKCSRIRLQRSNRKALIIRLPHLSRFGIIGREPSMPTVRKLSEEIAATIGSAQ